MTLELNVKSTQRETQVTELRNNEYIESELQKKIEYITQYSSKAYFGKVLQRVAKVIPENGTPGISNRIGVDQYVGQIIFEEAKRVTNAMTKEPPVPDEKTFTPPEVTIEKEEI